ncbi:MAG: hypothetical protein ABI867_23325, partial [Kofleriaceae bacterium]
LVSTGIGALPRWCKTGNGIAGHAQVAASAAILTLAFFCKQTGIIYVGLGGMIVLVLAWRRLLAFILTAGLLGLGGTWILQRSTDGWFWTYISKIHRAHDFNMDRFWKSFGNILWRTKGENYEFPTLGAPITIVVVAALVLVAVTWRITRRLPPQTQPLMIWSSMFAVSVVVGALGWGTEFAHFNAYMPAQLHGALAAGAALPAIYACTRILWGERVRRELASLAITAVAALPLAIVCYTARWEPARFIPTPGDVAAGDRLIARLRTLDGEVWMPSHPWYAYMAGKVPRVHRMGVKDVTARQTRTVDGLDAALDMRAFGAIVLDNYDLHNRENYAAILRNYRPAFSLPKADGPCGRSWVCRIARGLPLDERPNLYTGARVVPDSIWLPAIPAAPPAGAKALFDFESPTWGGWVRSGVAWGNGPVTAAMPGQDLVLGATGRQFATSMHDGDKSTGRITSPMFALDAARLSIVMGGGTDATKLRVELVVDDIAIEVASVPLPGGDVLKPVIISIPEDKRGKIGKLVFVDDSPTGHLDIDDVWAWAPKE